MRPSVASFALVVLPCLCIFYFQQTRLTATSWCPDGTDCASRQLFDKTSLQRAGHQFGLRSADYYRRYARAQDLEDLYAYEHFFYGVVAGTVLESGALDGIRYSTSWFFEKVAQWQAVHIEPSLLSFTALTRNRPAAVNIHSAVCDSTRRVHLLESGVGHRAAVNGIVEFMSDEFLRAWHPTLQRSDLSAIPEVLCQPVSAILSKLGLTHINLWILDVEGAELLALRSVQWDKVSFDVIAVEADGTNPQKDDAVQKLLISHGYQFHSSALRSFWFVRNGFAASARPASKFARMTDT